MTRGRVRWAWREQVCDSDGGLGELICSWRLGWRPVGLRNVAEKDEDREWWRAGKAKSVGEGLVSSPMTVRKPARLSSSSSMGFSLERMPTSSRSFDTII